MVGRSTLNQITIKTLLNKTKRRDPWFLDDYTINPYSGCSFNCLYCYIRGSKYGSHLEMKVAIKENALEVLDKQLMLRARKRQQGIVVISSATDPYLQAENETGLTRKILGLILKYRFPVHIITKSDLVIRDIDLLKEIEHEALTPNDLNVPPGKHSFITFSFSTTDDAIGKIFEPGASPPSKRLSALAKTIEAGFHSGVSLMPLIPFISDTYESLDIMYQQFHKAGARYVLPASMTLFGNGTSDSQTLMFRAIERHFPQLLSKYHELFSAGFQVPYGYREELNKKTRLMADRYGLKSSIL
jgi:DNA repair photolyase